MTINDETVGVLCCGVTLEQMPLLIKQRHSVLLFCCGAFQELSCSPLSVSLLINQMTKWQCRHRPKAMPSSDPDKKNKKTRSVHTCKCWSQVTVFPHDRNKSWHEIHSHLVRWIYCSQTMEEHGISNPQLTLSQHLTHLAFNDRNTFCPVLIYKNSLETLVSPLLTNSILDGTPITQACFPAHPALKERADREGRVKK